MHESYEKLLSSAFIAMMLISSLSIFIGVQPSFAENKAIDPSAKGILLVCTKRSTRWSGVLP